jgi:NDP-sugar pyrophosphorylase family protein
MRSGRIGHGVCRIGRRRLIAAHNLPPALVLTAGLGTRLRPLTYLRAKAAVPINGESLVERVLRWLATAGVSDIVLNLHHRPQTITSIVGDGTDLGLRVRYSWEQPVLGSAGGPRRALPLVTSAPADTFLIVNGDTLTDVDVDALLARHHASGAVVTMALIENPDPSKYGGVLVSEDGWVTGFGPRQARADPEQGQRVAVRGSFSAVRSSYHFIGVQVAQAATFSELEDGVPSESVNMLYPKLIAQNPQAIAAHISPASFLDIGTPRDCLDTSLALAEVEGAHLMGTRVRIEDSAVLSRTVLWDDVTVGARAQLRECIVGDGVRIPEDARFERCAIVPADNRSPREDEQIEQGVLIRRL